jgi:hypothetical protein
MAREYPLKKLIDPTDATKSRFAIHPVAGRMLGQLDDILRRGLGAIRYYGRDGRNQRRLLNADVVPRR